MIRFKQFMKENDGVFGMQKYEKILASYGYEYKILSGKRIAVVTDKNRVQLLKDLSKNTQGSRYEPVLSGSSVGGVITSDGFTILAKPKKATGSGAGAAMTALAESAQCLYCAAVWYGNSDFSVDGLKKVYSHVDVTETAEKIAKDLPGDWQDAAIVTAKKLYEKFKGNKYTFHRGSSWVNNLENKFKELNKREKEFSNVNKWSPADIYMVSSEGEKENFKQANSILELNALILKHVQNKTIIPVSLKKVASDEAAIKYINFSNDKSTYEIKNPVYTVGKKGFFESKDVYMNFVQGEIQFRGFNVVDFQGEIKGKYSAHGKIGGGVIKNVIKKSTGFDMETPSVVAKRISKDRDAFYKDFYKYYRQLVTGSILDYNKFVSECLKKDEGWHISKYLGTQMLYAIKNASKSKLEEIIGAMLGYAASESELSAVYVKVS
jgi:hypothetical protein